MSPEVASALYYVDTKKRVATLIGSGWVRDEGSALYASGAEPHVVAVMVAAAKAKGWSAVRIWGDTEFLAEARRQFEAAGIPVTVAGEPTRTPRPDFNCRLREEVVDYFRNRKNDSEEQIRLLNMPVPASTMLQGSRKKRDTARLKWLDACSQAFQAKKDFELAQYNFENASIFQKGKAIIVRDAAQKSLDDFEQHAAFLRDELKAAEKFLATVQSVHDQKCLRQAEENREKLQGLA